jgi:hypothetical protein
MSFIIKIMMTVMMIVRGGLFRGVRGEGSVTLEKTLTVIIKQYLYLTPVVAPANYLYIYKHKPLTAVGALLDISDTEA